MKAKLWNLKIINIGSIWKARHGIFKIFRPPFFHPCKAFFLLLAVTNRWNPSTTVTFFSNGATATIVIISFLLRGSVIQVVTFNEAQASTKRIWQQFREKNSSIIWREWKFQWTQIKFVKCSHFRSQQM